MADHGGQQDCLLSKFSGVVLYQSRFVYLNYPYQKFVIVIFIVNVN